VAACHLMSRVVLNATVVYVWTSSHQTSMRRRLPSSQRKLESTSSTTWTIWHR